MRYLLLNGTPHTGNTWRVVGLLREQILRLFPNADFEEIHLKDINLPYCTGCSNCFREGPDACPHRVTMDPLIQKIESCDGLIFAVTTFNRMPNAMAKNFIDHLCYMLHRPYFFRAKALVVSTTGGVGARKAVGYVAGTFRGMGFNSCYGLPLSSHSWNNIKIDEKLKEKCRKTAVRFHSDVSSGILRIPSFMTMIPYNMFRGMGRAYVRGTPFAMEDGVFWSSPERMNQVYDQAVTIRNPLKRGWGQLFFGIGLLAGKMIPITYKKNDPLPAARRGDPLDQ